MLCVHSSGKMSSFATVKLLLVSLLLNWVNCENSQIWDTKDEFFNRLPATLTPILSTSTQTSGECFMYCLMKNCSSVGYSETYQSCKLFSHPNLAKPLPQLAVDPTGQQHRMYYKRNFCPAGWEADVATGKCYFMDTTTQLRPASWQVCEEHLMSEMVTFQSALQRDNLYQILSSKYSSTTKWWTGYALFDSQLWPRPIDEFPGYRAVRGNCPNNDIANFYISPAECALKCDRAYRDQCAGFIYNGPVGRCWLKSKTCNGQNLNDKALGTEVWWYEKVHAGRPPTKNVGVDTGNSDVTTTIHDVSLNQCKKYARTFVDAASFSYYSDVRDCWIHRRASTAKTACTNCDSYDLNDISDGWCPFGVRYRDVCFVKLKPTASMDYNGVRTWCRTMGGKFSRPDGGKRKASYFYGVGGNIYFDYVDLLLNGNYTTQFDGLTLTNPFYDRWTWNGGEPSPGEFCTDTAARLNDTTGTYVNMNNLPCSHSSLITAICELPITMSYPKDCRFTPLGREYMGKLAQTQSGAICASWSSSTYSGSWRQFPDWYTSINFCRSPDAAIMNQPWCYRSNDSVAEACDIPMCPESDWAPGQTYDQPEQPFAAITSTGNDNDPYYWTVESISTTANALCQIDMNKWCPYYFRGSCYQLYKVPNSHSEAQAVCQQNGWHLVTVNSMEEQKFLMKTVMSLGNQWMTLYGFHIGLQFNTTVGNWIWDSGEAYSSSPNMWQSGIATPASAGYCAILLSNQDGWWQSNPCTFKVWYICEIEIAG